MSSAIADSVMAATHKLVQQALHGQWQDVPKTVEQRRVLLDQLTASASPRDQQWLGALRQAMAESDAAVAQMSRTQVSRTQVSRTQNATAPAVTGPAGHPADAVNQIDQMMDMIKAEK